ncbi:esterase [Streptomyces sp. NPDC087420]|uniref:esterase n=1 Tax=Streptomyces sp. NPDC087420 TaxID=3365785 RepID=UPI003832A3FA
MQSVRRAIARRHLAHLETPKLPFGRIRLHWEPASPAGWDVTAHLGLATTEVHLATWSAVPNDWPRLIRPTLHEVLGLCAALDLSNRLAQV